LETRFDAVEKHFDQLGARFDRSEARHDTMRADIMARIDRLQETVDRPRDDIIVNFGNTDRVERVARAAIDDHLTTSELLRVMQRKIMRLETDVEALKGPH
jgi:hypothetical protein